MLTGCVLTQTAWEHTGAASGFCCAGENTAACMLYMDCPNLMNRKDPAFKELTATLQVTCRDRTSMRGCQSQCKACCCFLSSRREYALGFESYHWSCTCCTTEGSVLLCWKGFLPQRWPGADLERFENIPCSLFAQLTLTATRMWRMGPLAGPLDGLWLLRFELCWL